MAKLNTYTSTGTKTGLNLPKAFQEKINLDLLAQAVRVYQDRSHPGVSKVKTRSEINLTTAKVWRQKGTGRARHGARSAPIFVGGGVAHGPKGIKRTLKMPVKMGRKALLVALSLKADRGEIVAASNLSKIEKTKNAQKLVDIIFSKENLKKGASASVVIRDENTLAKRAFRNLENVQILNVENLNTLQVFQGGLLIFEKEALDDFDKTRAVKKVEVEKKTAKKETGADKIVKVKSTTKSKIKKGTK